MSEVQCVNLMEEFGKRYRITFDPAYDPKHRPREKLDCWMMTIPCRPGTIYPYGGTELAIEVDGHRFVRAALSKLPCCREHQRGDDCGSFIFDVEDFDTRGRSCEAETAKADPGSGTGEIGGNECPVRVQEASVRATCRFTTAREHGNMS